MNKRTEERGQLIDVVRLGCPQRETIEAYGLDISAGGIGFLCDQPHPAGQHFDLTLSLPSGAGREEVTLTARLVRCDPTGDLIPYRIAAQFVDIDPALQERLRALISGGEATSL